MASWIDLFSLFATTLFFIGSILGILYIVKSISKCLQSTKTSLEQRGITISHDGISVKTSKRFDRDAYVDATQRGFVKALSAATVGSETDKHGFLRTSSTDSRHLNEQEKSIFGVALRRSHSDERGDEQ